MVFFPVSVCYSFDEQCQNVEIFTFGSAMTVQIIEKFVLELPAPFWQ